MRVESKTRMRALLMGAVEGTRVAFDAIAACPDWDMAAVATLPPEMAGRHSDFVDLTSVAADRGVPVLHAADCNAEDFVEQVRAVAPDWMFVIGWSQLCGAGCRAAVGDRVIGYHPAPLPRLRGRAVIPWTILLDEKITASTLFRIDAGTDSGEVLAQRFFHVAPRETAATLYAKHMAALRAMLDDMLPALARGALAGAKQDEGVATWATRRRPDDGRIDWSCPADVVDRLVRAVGRPYPGAFTEAGGKRLAIWSTSPSQIGTSHHAIPGQVIARDPASFVVACGEGTAIGVDAFDSATGKPPALHSMLGR